MSQVIDNEETFNEQEEQSETADKISEKSKASSSCKSCSTCKSEDACRRNILKGEKAELCINPFHLSWSFGLNLKVPLLNLTGKQRTLIGYAATHAGVLYDYVSKEMKLLQGHKNLISSISADGSGRWMVSVDNGEDNTLIVWDTYDFVPICTIFDPHPGFGTLVVGMSSNAKYIVTVGSESPCHVNFWLWTYGSDKPDDTYMTQVRGSPIKVCFNPDIQEHIMITFEKGVVFLEWNVQDKRLIAHPAPTIKNLKKLGSITDSTYVDQCHECLASTTEGSVVLFGSTLYSRKFEDGELQNVKFYVKAVKVGKICINCIASADNVVATGDSKGNIKFYDKTLKILYWCQKFDLPSITQICFHLEPRKYKLADAYDPNEDIFADSELDKMCSYEDRSEEYEHLYKQLVPSDATIERAPFIVRDFVIGTEDGRVALIDYMRNQCNFFFRQCSSDVVAIDVHDEKSLLVIAYTDNTICLYNYQTHEMITENVIPTLYSDEYGTEQPRISDIKFSHNSYFLACGKENGEVFFLEPVLLTLKDKQPKSISTNKITKMVFSQDSLYLAYYDGNWTIGLLKYSSEQECFMTIGKLKSHYKEINDILFSPDLPVRLFTIGNDRYIVEYDLENSEYPNIEILTRYRFEQVAIPLAFVYYPKSEKCKEKYFLVSDSEYKLKIVNDISFMCHSVVLGPAHGCYNGFPIRRMKILPNHGNSYIIFSNQFNLGIQQLPADGNPFKFVGAIAHPVELLRFRLDRQGKYVFTFGQNDNCVLMWEVNVSAVDAMMQLGGKDLEPYYCLIEGGINGWLFREMQDLFYYMQILHQGENTLLPRIVNEKISVVELPDLMRACGFYPSEYEIENMLIDVKYRNYDATSTLKDEITFFEFVQLYINYRPAHGVALETIRESFDVMCYAGEKTSPDAMSRSSFTALLCSRGEVFSVNKVRTCLAVLMHAENTDEDNDNLDFPFLPPDIDYTFFLEDLLGIDLEREAVEEQEKHINAGEEPENSCN